MINVTEKEKKDFWKYAESNDVRAFGNLVNRLRSENNCTKGDIYARVDCPNGLTLAHVGAGAKSNAVLNYILNTTEFASQEQFIDFVDEQDKNGRTALMLAAGNANHTGMRLLLDAGASVTLIDGERNSVLHYAAGNQARNTIILVDLYTRFRDPGLLDVNYRNYDGETALHEAAGDGNAESIFHTLDWGADPTIRSRKKLTPRGLAKQCGAYEALDAFDSRGITK